MVKVFTIKLSEEVIGEIEILANKMGITKNSLATLLLSHGIVYVKEQITRQKPIQFRIEVEEMQNKLDDIIKALNEERDRQEIEQIKSEMEENRKKGSGPRIGVMDDDEKM